MLIDYANAKSPENLQILSLTPNHRPYEIQRQAARIGILKMKGDEYRKFGACSTMDQTAQNASPDEDGSDAARSDA